MKKRNQIIAAFLAATMIITPATSIFAKAAKDGNSSAESSYGESFFVSDAFGITLCDGCGGVVSAKMCECFAKLWNASSPKLR